MENRVDAVKLVKSKGSNIGASRLQLTEGLAGCFKWFEYNNAIRYSCVSKSANIPRTSTINRNHDL